MAIQLPPVLRRAGVADQIATARGYGSIASRDNPLQYGSLFQQRNPGIVTNATPDPAAVEQQQQATQLSQLQTRLGLRQTRVALSDFDQLQGLRRQRNQLAAYRANQTINPRYANLGLDADNYDDQDDQ